jgi:phosphoribosylformylglycinamidine synthase subunit PurQ / glutaminase
MAQPRILVLRAPGSNCDQETAHAFSLAGGLPDRWHVNRVLEDPRRLSSFQVLCIPGGFSYGDDIAAGRILGSQLQHHLACAMEQFREAGKLIVGICNGFQVLLKTKLLDTADDKGSTATLTLNDSGRFEARWVRLQVEPDNCVFLQGMSEIELPVAHGEGKFVVQDPQVFAKMEHAGRFVMRYSAGSQAPQTNSGSCAVPYPENPNGAMGNVAGICDSTGRVLGLMPHPERHVDRTQHPRWTRQPERKSGDGLRVFQNAIRYFQ